MVRSACFLVLAAAFTLPVAARAHCDTTRGPVVTAARAALDRGDPRLVLHWVRPQDEATIRSAFEQTVSVRRLGPEAKALADRFFFETLVRIHRAGEGAPYTGLAEGAPEPIIAATDAALERGSSADLERMLVDQVRDGLAERFSRAHAARKFTPGDVAAGRAFVAAYVPLTHWVEGVSTAAGATAEHHGSPGHQEPEARPRGHEDPEQRERGDVSPAHGRGALLPWSLTALLGIAAVAEGALLLRNRRRPNG